MPRRPIGSGPLAGHRILVLEDEYFLADDIVRALQALGAGVVGPFGELADAAGSLDGDISIDAAIIDINLRSEMVFPLARILKERKIPFVFATGYDRTSIEAEFQDIRVWEKPVDLTAMANDLSNMIENR
jgi:DNA-binding response OmpR family regulator